MRTYRPPKTELPDGRILDGENIIDDVAVELAMMGTPGVRLTRTELLEVVRRLTDRGLSALDIGARIGCSDRVVVRCRAAILNRPAPWAAFTRDTASYVGVAEPARARLWVRVAA